MTRAGLVQDTFFRRHETGNHPEHAGRLDAIEAYLKAVGLWDEVTLLEPASALRQDLLRAHDAEVLDRAVALCNRGGGYLDTDTVVGPLSAEVAGRAAGGLMTATREVLSGALQRVLCLVRPPGHHATRSRSMGFCLYNNIAVATRFLLHVYEIERVAIVDFDVHHGNGTQDIFYSDPNVFYFSIHQHPLYPMTGLAGELGEGDGEGTTLNVPLPPGTCREKHLEAYEKGLDEVFRFKPEFLFLSAGFDAHVLDPLGQLQLESEDFGTMTRSVVSRAAASAVKGIVSSLEGGYHLHALGESVAHHLRALME